MTPKGRYTLPVSKVREHGQCSTIDHGHVSHKYQSAYKYQKYNTYDLRQTTD